MLRSAHSCVSAVNVSLAGLITLVCRVIPAAGWERFE